MAQAKRNDIDPHGALPSWQDPVVQRQQPSSPIARLQADLARRLSEDAAQTQPDTISPTEQVVQRLSAIGGLISLGLGYAIAGAGLAWWIWA